MSKLNAFHPRYQLRSQNGRGNEIVFKYANTNFVTKTPLFGMSETSKLALKWAEEQRTPPVVRIIHGNPSPSERNILRPEGIDPHRHYYPYAISVATLECLGEQRPRRIKVYFCDVETHIHHEKIHTHDKGYFIEEL